MTGYRVVLVTHAYLAGGHLGQPRSAIPESHLIRATESGPPFIAACGKHIFGRLLAPAEVEVTIQTPCSYCLRAVDPRVRRAFARARPDAGPRRIWSDPRS